MTTQSHPSNCGDDDDIHTPAVRDVLDTFVGAQGTHLYFRWLFPSRHRMQDIPGNVVMRELSRLRRSLRPAHRCMRLEALPELNRLKCVGTRRAAIVRLS